MTIYCAISIGSAAPATPAASGDVKMNDTAPSDTCTSVEADAESTTGQPAPPVEAFSQQQSVELQVQQQVHEQSRRRSDMISMDCFLRDCLCVITGNQQRSRCNRMNTPLLLRISH